MCLVHLFKKKILKNLPYARPCVLHEVTVWRERGLALRPFLTQKKAMCWQSESLGGKEAPRGSDLLTCYKTSPFPVLIFCFSPLLVTAAGWDQSAGATQAPGAYLKMRLPRYHL